MTYIAISVFLGALIGCIIWNEVLGRTLKFKAILLANALIATISIIGFMLLLMTENIFLLMISTFFCGFSICAFLPISIEYGCEIAFPVGEGSSAGFLQASVHLFGLIFVRFFYFLIFNQA
jgi:MFS transporter, FLVCR family, feline leukemia virus subgroup C receptor-related protein